MGIIIATHEHGCAPDGIRSRWGMWTSQYKPNTGPEEHLTLSLWWFLTVAEQVSLFISEEIWTFSILYFLKHMKNPLIIFVLLQFEDEMSPTPSLLSSAPHFLWNCHFQGCSLVPDRLLPTQPSIQSKRLNEEGWGSEDGYSEPSQNTCFILCISFYFLKENSFTRALTWDFDFPLDLRTDLILGGRTSGNKGKAHMRRLRRIFTYDFNRWQLIFLNLQYEQKMVLYALEHSVFNSDACDYLMGMRSDVFFFANRDG